MKFVDVLIMDTCVAEVPRASAVVKSVHIFYKRISSCVSVPRIYTYNAIEDKIKNEEALYMQLAMNTR